LDGVTVAGADEDVVALVRTARGEGREDVVGLDALLGEHRHVHRGEAVLQQRNLALELRRRLGAVRLVLGVLLGAEGVTGRVEGDGEMRRLLRFDEVDEHRQEAVDAVRVLTVARREVVHGKGEEGAVRQRMAVYDEESRLCGVRHPATLDAGTDTGTPDPITSEGGR